MACNITLSGIVYDCQANLAGVKKVYITDYQDVSTYDVSQGKVTSLALSGGAKFYEYTFNKNTASMTSTLTKDETNGYSFYTTELTGNINKLDVAKRNELMELMGGRLTAIVVDKNDESWITGLDVYATGTAMTAQTGAAPEDGNYYNLTITAESPEMPFGIDPSVYTSLISTL